MMDENYTRTGNNFFSSASRFLSYIPFGGFGIATFLTKVFGYFGAAIDGLGWLMRGKILSAITAFGTGAAETTVNSMASLSGANLFSTAGLLYWGNVASGVATNGGLGKHARKLSEVVVGGVTQPLGLQPTVLRSYYAGIGGMGGAAASGPGYWATRAAQERGLDPNARYAAYRSGDGADHVAALEAAAGQGQYRSM